MYIKGIRGEKMENELGHWHLQINKLHVNVEKYRTKTVVNLLLDMKDFYWVRRFVVNSKLICL